MSIGRLKVLLVHPGAHSSVSDVFDNLRYGLNAHGVEVIPYGLASRLKASHDRMHFEWRVLKKADATLRKPTWIDVRYEASVGILERALRHEVDMVLIVAGLYIHPDALILCRRAGLKTGILFTESPYAIKDEVKLAQYVDLALTNEKTSVPAFARVCPVVGYIPHGWNPTTHTTDTPLPASTPKHDVVFVGTGWPERVKLFEAINWDGIDFGLYGTAWRLSRRSPLQKCLRDNGSIPNTEAVDLYRAAKIGINVHRSLMGWDFGGDPHMADGSAYSANPRAFELAAVGAFHISDRRQEVLDRFGDAVPTFASPGDAESLIRQWLADDAGRARIAHQLPALVAEDTWLHRAGEVIVHIEHALAVARAA